MGQETKANLKEVVVTPDVGKNRVVTILEDLLRKAKQGEIIGMVYGVKESDSYAYGKVNLGYDEVLALLCRMGYYYNNQWDVANSESPPPPAS